jgi:predicted SprT family Zn-dependent metalloprotease
VSQIAYFRENRLPWIGIMPIEKNSVFFNSIVVHRLIHIHIYILHLSITICQKWKNILNLYMIGENYENKYS